MVEKKKLKSYDHIVDLKKYRLYWDFSRGTTSGTFNSVKKFLKSNGYIVVTVGKKIYIKKG